NSHCPAPAQLSPTIPPSGQSQSGAAQPSAQVPSHRQGSQSGSGERGQSSTQVPSSAQGPSKRSIHGQMRSPVKTSTRIFTLFSSQPRLREVTPICTSPSPRSEKVGPPESPLQVLYSVVPTKMCRSATERSAESTV